MATNQASMKTKYLINVALVAFISFLAGALFTSLRYDFEVKPEQTNTTIKDTVLIK